MAMQEREMASRKEKLPAIEKFSPEASSFLKSRGFVIYDIPNVPVGDLIDKIFFLQLPKEHDAILNQRPRNSQIAIDPQEFLLQRSDQITLARAKELAGTYSTALSARVDGVRANLGRAAEIIALAYAYQQETGERFLGKESGLKYTRTSDGYVVGHNTGLFGLSVDKWSNDHGYSRVHAGVIVVPEKVMPLYPYENNSIPFSK